MAHIVRAILLTLFMQINLRNFSNHSVFELPPFQSIQLDSYLHYHQQIDEVILHHYQLLQIH